MAETLFAHKTPDKMVQALAGIIFRKETAKEMAKKIGNEKLLIVQPKVGKIN